MQYSFHVHNRCISDGMTIALDELLRFNETRKIQSKPHKIDKMGQAGMCSTQNIIQNSTTKQAVYEAPIIVCVGSDLAVGDSLGPITGSMLAYKTQGLKNFIYGSLSAPITAKEIKYLRTFLKETHKNTPVIAIDAAVGIEGDIGQIKLSPTPLFPGAGANKKLGAIGDISILGIVAEKSIANYGLLNTTRLHLVYSMAERISDALASILYERKCTPQSKSV